jgi:hypothetical protein
MSSLVYVASNNANSTLAGNLTALSTSFSVYTGQGSRFPVINDGGTDNNQYTKITLQKTDGTKEIVNVVRHDTGSDAFTIGVPGTVTGSVSGRAQEGSSATTWSIGDVVACRPTADLMEEAVNLGAKIAASDAKTALHDDDTFGISDGEASALTKKTTWANIKSLLTTLFDALYLPLAGGTLTGNVTVNGHVTLGAGKTLVYEGTTDDAHELTVSPGEPTADRTQTHPDMSGTIAVQARGSDIASASTINLTTATGDIVDVTGITTITAITLADGAERKVRFTGALTLTHGASLVLPGLANITTADGDFAVFRGYAAGVVRCTAYQKASGEAVTPGVFTVPYDSGNQTISTSGQLVLPHGLGAIPKIVMFTAKCLTAELGFSVGDELYLGGGGNAYNGAGSSNRQGFSASFDATNITIQFSDEAAALGTIRKDTGDFGGMTNSSWAFIARAYS